MQYFTPAIARSPQLAQLGRNCLAMGQWQAASAIFQCILEALPGDASAAAGLATATANAITLPVVGRNEPCPCGSGRRYKHCHGAAGASPASALAPRPTTHDRVTAALAAHQRGDASTAESIYREVLGIEPDHTAAAHYLGVLEYQRGELAAALPRLERSVRAVPGEPEYHNNLGLAYAAADREHDAIDRYRAALELKPDHAIAWNNLGLALQSTNDLAGATDAFRRAIALKPDFAHAHWNLALVLLLAGRFDEGWAEYEWRLALPELGKGRHVYPGPAWDGAAMGDRTLLLYAEQGLGDAVQFARYATPIAATGARVLIHCAPSLQALLATIPGVAQVVTGSASLPPYDAHAPLLSLPRLLKTTLASIPAPSQYLRAADDDRIAARSMLGARGERLKVGVAWAGSREHTNDRNRSCPLAVLAPMFGLDDIAWFSLQQGEAAAQWGTTPGTSAIVPLAEGSSLSATAALIAELDLVISVDTSIVHLAGALGRPCWVLLPFAPDWRWLLGRDDSPWYPTLRLFRQRAPRDWSELVVRVISALRQFERE